MTETLVAESVLKKCLHPSAAPGVCNKIVDAHTIQRSTSLGRIVDRTNHALTFPPMQFDAGTGALQLRKIGWRDASTFTGFCAKHDSETFRALETKDFEASDEQCFLIGYRALCHEIHQKSRLLKADAAVRDMVDRGRSFPEQRVIQEMWASLNAGTLKGLEDFGKLKSVMDERLLARNFRGWRRAVVTFSGDLCVVSTGAVSPNRDLDGNELQDLNDPNCSIEELTFGITALAKGGAAVFLWEEGAAAPQSFVESMLKNDLLKLPSLIVQFAFAYIENTFFSADWWNSLPKTEQDHIERLANIAFAYYEDHQYSSARLVPWEIQSVSLG